MNFIEQLKINEEHRIVKGIVGIKVDASPKAAIKVEDLPVIGAVFG